MEATIGNDLVLPHYLDAAFSNVNQFIDNTQFFLQMITRNFFYTQFSALCYSCAIFCWCLIVVFPKLDHYDGWWNANINALLPFSAIFIAFNPVDDLFKGWLAKPQYFDFVKFSCFQLLFTNDLYRSFNFFCWCYYGKHGEQFYQSIFL